MKMDAHSNDRESLITPYGIKAIARFLRLGLPVTGSFFEKLIGDCALGALLRHVGFNPADLVVQELHPMTQFFDREQAEVLPDLMHDLFLRPIVVIDRRHRSVSRYREI